MALFVGGQADGRRMAVQYPEKYIRLPYIEPFARPITPSLKEQLIGEMRVEEYVLAYNDIYIHVSLDRKDLIKLLATGYRHEDAVK